MKFNIYSFFETLARIFEFRLNLTRTTGTLQEEVRKFLRNVSYGSCRYNRNTDLVVQKIFPENRTVYEIM